MAFPIPAEVGNASLVAMFAIDKAFAFARNNRENKVNTKRCIEHESSRIAMQNNAIMASATVEIKAIMQKILESSIEQTLLLKSLNGKKTGG